MLYFKSACLQGRNVDALILYFGEDPSRCPFEQGVWVKNGTFLDS